MTTFVLTHGAWHGSWCWSKVTPFLQQKGYKVITPDLPGHGNHRSRVADVTLQLYTDFLCGIVEQQPEPVILVGHSMAGIVISQVAEQLPDRISRLVYLTAFMLNDGQSLLEVTQNDKAGLVLPNLVYSRDRKSATVKETIIQQAFYNDCKTEDFAWASCQLVPEPLAPLSTPVHISGKNWGSVPAVYIECSMDNAISPVIQRQMHQDMQCKTVIQMESGHSPFLSANNELVEALSGLSLPDY